MPKPTSNSEVEAILKRVIAYGFDKGYANDHKPNHELANQLRDEMLDLIAKSNQQAVRNALEPIRGIVKTAKPGKGIDGVAFWIGVDCVLDQIDKELNALKDRSE